MSELGLGEEGALTTRTPGGLTAPLHRPVVFSRTGLLSLRPGVPYLLGEAQAALCTSLTSSTLTGTALLTPPPPSASRTGPGGHRQRHTQTHAGAAPRPPLRGRCCRNAGDEAPYWPDMQRARLPEPAGRGPRLTPRQLFREGR